MKAIANFLVKGRKILFALFMVLTVASCVAFFAVNINKDMTKYIPADLSSKVGTDLMNDEFGESSQFKVMMMDLTDEQKTAVAEDLKYLINVSTVQYDIDSVDFNHDNASLFIVVANGDTYSQEALDTHQAIRDYAASKNYECYVDSVVIDSMPIDLLPVILPALVIVFGIMFMMASSWIETVLLLFSVGIAVVMNMGSNIIFDSVSETTFSIAAVLQLILSLDYSIMLLTRYRIERVLHEDKNEAMKNALSGSGGAIASSSMTTIVGLVCLVFMSFTIGADMGLVLAKGVFMSLLCVYAVMPMLILACDNLMKKTAKRSPIPNTTPLSNLVHKLRVPLLILFALLFATGLFFRNSTGISYFIASENPDRPIIQEHFDLDSQVVVLYHTEDEGNFAPLIGDIESMDGVTSVNAYGNTLGKQHTAESMSAETDMDQTFIKLLYYKYFSQGSTPNLTVAQFAAFIRDEVLTNPSFSGEMKGVSRGDLDTFVKIATPSQIKQKRSASSMAHYLSGSGQGMSAEDVQQIYLAHYMKNVDASKITATLPQFVSFLKNDVATNPEFKDMFTKEDLDKINQLSMFTNVADMTKQRSAEDMAAFFGLDARAAQAVYALHGYMHKTETTSMSVQQLLAFILDEIVGSPYLEQIKDSFDLSQLYMLRNIVDSSVAGTRYNAAGMAEFLGMDASDLEQLYLYYGWNYGGKNNYAVSAIDLISFIITESNGGLLDGQLSQDSLNQLQTLKGIMDGALAGTTYSPEGLVSLLSPLSSQFDTSSAKLVYLLYGSQHNYNSAWTMSIEEFLTYVRNDVLNDSLFGGQMSSQDKADIEDGYAEMLDGKKRLVGGTYNMAVITVTHPDESDGMDAFLTQLRGLLDANLNETYLLGQGAMAQEMGASFTDEFNFISLITVAAIFLIVLLAFRSLFIPFLLVMLIQCAFCLTMAFNSFVGSDIYYVALIVVQAILMGATIDYAILFTSNYREQRRELGVKQSMAGAYQGSIRTMLTSGTILIAVTALIGNFVAGITGQICLVISEGCFIALMLVLLILPAMLAIFDKMVVPKKERFEEGLNEGDSVPVQGKHAAQ